MAHFTESKNHYLRGAKTHFSRGTKTTNYKQLSQTRMPNHKKNLEKPLLGTLQTAAYVCDETQLTRHVADPVPMIKAC